jgi:hypothetical protein
MWHIPGGSPSDLCSGARLATSGNSGSDALMQKGWGRAPACMLGAVLRLGPLELGLGLRRGRRAARRAVGQQLAPLCAVPATSGSGASLGSSRRSPHSHASLLAAPPHSPVVIVPRQVDVADLAVLLELGAQVLGPAARRKRRAVGGRGRAVRAARATARRASGRSCPAGGQHRSQRAQGDHAPGVHLMSFGRFLTSRDTRRCPSLLPSRSLPRLDMEAGAPKRRMCAEDAAEDWCPRACLPRLPSCQRRVKYPGCSSRGRDEVTHQAAAALASEHAQLQQQHHHQHLSSSIRARSAPATAPAAPPRCTPRPAGSSGA